MRKAIDPGFLPWLHQAIPLTAYLGIQSLRWQQDTLVAELSLAPLVNDKGTGFGGGVAGLATLLGWCFVTLILDEDDRRCPVVVKESSNRFTAPITDDFTLYCCCETDPEAAVFLERFAERGRAGIELQIEARQDEQTAFSYQGTYVALGHG